MINKKQSILEKAKKIESQKGRHSNGKITPEMIEAAVAWANDEVKLNHISAAMGLHNGSKTYIMLALALKEYIKKKEVK